ncbi:MAG: DsbA family protein [bacterium]|nr:DsbA family protein [bacterium]
MEQKSSPISLPAAIIIAGALIAISVIWVKKPVTVAPEQATLPEVSMAAVTSADHILGNPNAKIKIVEFSDASCPFCKIFHPVMKQVIEKYGPSGDVAWVYRHFPLPKHVNAKNEAHAMECAASLGGNDAFWKYVHRIYEVTPSDQNLPLNQAELPNIAKYIGLDVTAFNQCQSSLKFMAKIEKQFTDGTNAMLATRVEERGTPYTVIITPTGTKIPLVGAQNFATLDSVIATILSEEAK